MTGQQHDMLVQAKVDVRTARDLRQRGNSRAAASRAYYAMFYLAEAFLEGEGKSFSKHSAVIAAFGQHFAKTGRIDPKYHRMFINARKLREIVDYDIQGEIIDRTAVLKIEDGREFVSVVKGIIKNLKESR